MDARVRGGAACRWTRVPVGSLGLLVPVLVADPRELTHVDLEALGFARLGALVGVGSRAPTVPRIATVVADVSRDRAVDLLRLDGETVERVAGATFASAHPEDWSDAVHDGGAVTVLVADLPALAAGAPGVLAGAAVATVPLVVRPGGAGA